MGAAFVVDGTQSVGAQPMDIRKVQPDALVCAGYKWLLGPYSIGVSYYGSRYEDGVPLEESWAAREGAEDFASLVHQGERYRPGAVRYDVGETASFALVPMLAEGLGQLLEWGVPRIARYIGGLTDTLFADDRLRALELADRSPDAAHVFGLRLPTGTDPGNVADRLAELDVHVSVRGQFVRVSPHVYNDEEDIEALVEALETAVLAGA